MDYLAQARERFKADIFATETTGIVIDEVAVGYAKCSFAINESHMNAASSVMGGAIFTLADFAFAVAANAVAANAVAANAVAANAVAANAGAPLTVSLSSQINYLSRAKGKRLIAEAKCIKSGRNTCFYNIDVSDDLENLVAVVTTNGFIKA